MSRVENWASRVRKYPRLRHWRLWAQVRGLYLFALRWMTFNRGLRRTLYPGIELRVSYASRQTMAADFSDTLKWDVPCLDLIRRWIGGNPHACFFDIGANHGQFALVVSRWLDPQTKRIYAFEPNSDNRAVLEENLRRCDCKNVEVVSAALGDRRDYMMLHGESVTASLVPTQNSGEPGEQVMVETLDGFCERQGCIPDVVKIDVEGFELAVLRGGAQTLQDHADTIKIICEMHTFMWSEPDHDLDLIRLAASYGLRVFRLDGSPVERIREYGHYVLAKEFSRSDG